jgi:phage FluMu protein Com
MCQRCKDLKEHCETCFEAITYEHAGDDYECPRCKKLNAIPEDYDEFEAQTTHEKLVNPEN